MGNANGWRLGDCRTVISRHPAPAELCQLLPAHAPNTLCERELGLGSGWGARARAARGRRTTVVIAVALDASTMSWQPWLSQLSHVVVAAALRNQSLVGGGWWRAECRVHAGWAEDGWERTVSTPLHSARHQSAAAAAARWPFLDPRSLVAQYSLYMIQRTYRTY